MSFLFSIAAKKKTAPIIWDANVIYNGGAANTSDWTKDTNGLADGWGGAATSSTSIVTGNGFNGNAQRATRNGGQNYFSVIQLDTAFLASAPAGKWKLSLKFRCEDSRGQGLDVWVGTTDDYFHLERFGENTGNAQYEEVIFETTGAIEELVFGFWDNHYPLPSGTYWLEIDEVTLQPEQ